MVPNRLTMSVAVMSACLAVVTPASSQSLEQGLASITKSARKNQTVEAVVPEPAVLLARLQQQGRALLVLERTKRVLNRTGDPIWDLRLEIPGQPARHFDALSGRAGRQNANRHQLGSRAPLPAGQYTLGPVESLADGAYPELGPVWIGIEPTFPTGRRVLGIHQDPSAGRNANSGTLGCIGLIHRHELLELAQQIRQASIRELVVTH